MSDFLEKAVSDAYFGQFTTKFDADVFWQLVSGFLVFFMHAGFATLEAGSISDKHKVNILYKNTAVVALGGIAYFVLGYGLAYGNGPDNSFLGGDFFYGTDLEQGIDGGKLNRIEFFFQYAFCITAATITSGAVAGRIRIEAFLVLAVFLTGFVYPAVTHWVWSTTGFLSAFKGSPNAADFFLGNVYDHACGVIDFAGSGVVHLTGGVSALIGAIILGPRYGRFDKDGVVTEMPGHNLSIATLGTFILWFGWYGFNCGSTLAFDGVNAAKVAVTTSLAPAAACMTSIVVQRYRLGYYDLPGCLNAILAGLVSVTAGCSTIFDYAAIPIGFVGALLYIWSSELLVKLKIDDPIGAVPVHGVCGAWGVLAVGFFANPTDYATAYGCPNPVNASEDADWLEPLPGYQMLTQLTLIGVVVGWVILTITPLFLIMKYLKVLRVPEEEEIAGLDASEHGVPPYEDASGDIGTEEEEVKVVEEGEAPAADDSKVSPEIAEKEA